VHQLWSGRVGRGIRDNGRGLRAAELVAPPGLGLLPRRRSALMCDPSASGAPYSITPSARPFASILTSLSCSRLSIGFRSATSLSMTRMMLQPFVSLATARWTGRSFTHAPRAVGSTPAMCGSPSLAGFEPKYAVITPARCCQAGTGCWHRGLPSTPQSRFCPYERATTADAAPRWDRRSRRYDGHPKSVGGPHAPLGLPVDGCGSVVEGFVGRG